LSRDFAQDTLAHCRIALKHHGGHPNGAWSSGEQLAVALVLDDHEHLKAMGYTFIDAAERVRGGMLNPPADFLAWLEAIRTELNDAGRTEDCS
jgi:hypothetical protein